MERIYENKVDIEYEDLKNFYEKRAIEKVSLDIDAPVVLCGDQDVSKIESWNKFEVSERLPLLSLNENSVVLEVGCGTGRISKYITPIVDTFVGIDYVKEFIDIVNIRKDIKKRERTFFLHGSIQDLINGNMKGLPKKKYNRFVISGGVLMYINDSEVKLILKKLIEMFDNECILYLSEPIALEERLTLKNFYSEELKNLYSAIYRTEEEYMNIFKVFYDNGFELKVNEEFFYEDIKVQKETKQWIFILQRGTK